MTVTCVAGMARWVLEAGNSCSQRQSWHLCMDHHALPSAALHCAALLVSATVLKKLHLNGSTK